MGERRTFLVPTSCPQCNAPRRNIEQHCPLFECDWWQCTQCNCYGRVTRNADGSHRISHRTRTGPKAGQ